MNWYLQMHERRRGWSADRRAFTGDSRSGEKCLRGPTAPRTRDSAGGSGEGLLRTHLNLRHQKTHETSPDSLSPG